MVLLTKIFIFNFHLNFYFLLNRSANSFFEGICFLGKIYALPNRKWKLKWKIKVKFFMPLLVSDGNIELQKRTWPQDDKVVTSIELKITKWTLIKPFCRFNTVVLVIIIYVSIVTAIFILFYQWFLNKPFLS